jgi:hypothetical protein
VIHDFDPTLENLAYVVAHLRERDQREIYALRWDEDPHALLVELHRAVNPLWRVWCWNMVPVAVQGVYPARPGVALAACFGTDHWDKAVPKMIRYARAVVPLELAKRNVHRVEAHSLAANADTHRFIELTGGEQEAVLHEFGRDKEDFLLYRWKVEDVLRRWRRREQRNPAPILHEG